MITVTSAGKDRLRIETRGHIWFTDQPVADGGEDTAPTPTEMFVASLAACVGFYAERFLRRNGVAADQLSVTCDYSWAEGPHRVGGIDLTVVAPGLGPDRMEAFKRVIGHCTVHNTLANPPEVRMHLEGTEALAALMPS